MRPEVADFVFGEREGEQQVKEVMTRAGLRGMYKGKGRTLVCHRIETQSARPPQIVFYPMYL
jgi:hypothetical protein